MFLCDHCQTMNHFGDWAFNHGGLEVGLPAFELPMFAKCDYCRCQEEICFACLFRLKNLSLHFLPVAWCSWELVFYSLPPPVHHGDSFAAKELLFPLLSPRIIFAHRIQSTAGRIWPVIERFDRCAAVPCDSALIRWQIALPSKIQDVAEFGGGISSLCEGSWQLDKDQGSWRKWVQSSLRMRSSCAHKPAQAFLPRCVPVKEQKPALGHTSMWLIWNCHCDCRLFGCFCPWNFKVHQNKYPCLLL